jgi:hypothetical protein
MGISQLSVVKHPYAERTFDYNKVNTIPIFLRLKIFTVGRSWGMAGKD